VLLSFVGIILVVDGMVFVDLVACSGSGVVLVVVCMVRVVALVVLVSVVEPEP
jgi:hypothetical protein